jgi:prepilin-type N-terminal cleavage/methylation domain-containing protein
MIRGKQKKGFTLLEILLVIAAIGVLAAIVLIAINPNKQIEAARTAQRRSDQNNIAKAIQQYIIDPVNGGAYPGGLQNIPIGATVGLCNTTCSNGINLSSALAPIYIASIPVPPDANGQYTVTKTANGVSAGYDSGGNTPAIVSGSNPNLDLNFARDKMLFNSTGSIPISFTRAETNPTPNRATYIGSDGLLKTAAANEPRFDHNPATGESLGLLVEESRTNLFINSDIEGPLNTQPTNFSAAIGLGQSILVSTDFAIGPNSQSAKHTRGTGGDNNIGYTSSNALTAGIEYSTSAWVYIPTSEAANFVGRTIIACIENPVSSQTCAAADVAITGRWQRITGRFVPTTASANMVLRTNALAGAVLYTDAWQMELGSFSTSYISTLGSTVQRFTDNVSITGANFTTTPGGWYNQAAGTWFSQFSPIYTATATVPSYTPHIFQVYNTASTTNNYALRGAENGTNLLGVARNSIPTLVFPGVNAGGYLSANTKYKVSYAINSTDLILALNGTLGGLQTNTAAAGMATHDRLDIGSGTGGGPPYALNGRIARLTFWPSRLPNNILQSLTQ